MSSAKHNYLYAVTSRDDFDTMIEVKRYARRSSDFDEIISLTNEHYWNPLDPAYIDFQQPFDTAAQSILPAEFFPEMHSAIAEKLDDGQKVEMVNELTRFIISQLLHGEQAALSLSTSLCQILVDPGAVEYAANQAREEARHVTVFTEYLKVRFDGEPYKVSEMLGVLMRELYMTPHLYKKLVGMQMIIEGLAMGTFVQLYTEALDPVLRRVCQLTLADEAFHIRFGKIWGEKEIPNMADDERNVIEDWAWNCFEVLLRNLSNVEQKRPIFLRFGIEPAWAMGALSEAVTDADRRRLMSRPNNLYRVLIKTLSNAGIITERTAARYANFINLKELQSESEVSVGDPVAQGALQSLRDINQNRRQRFKNTSARLP